MGTGTGGDCPDQGLSPFCAGASPHFLSRGWNRGFGRSISPRGEAPGKAGCKKHPAGWPPSGSAEVLFQRDFKFPPSPPNLTQHKSRTGD